MSDDFPYATRLRWHAGTGFARHDGVRVELRRAPDLGGLEGVTDLDFVPGVCAMVREGCGPVDDLTDRQKNDALALLQSMAAAARRVMDRNSES